MTIMELMKKKIQSRRGASITYALLLFLVAAVIGSVVLAAGTAAGGRLSRTAQMDQRYYSVNSAARLLIDTITGEDAIKVVKTTESGKTPSYKYYVGSMEKTITGNSFSSLALAAAYFLEEKPIDPKDKITIDISAPEIDKDNDKIDLAVTAEESLYSDGSIHLSVYDKNKKYIINVTLAADKQQTRELDILGGSEIETTTFKWTLAEIEDTWSLPTATSEPTPTSTGG